MTTWIINKYIMLVCTLNLPSEALFSFGRSHKHQQQPEAFHLTCIVLDCSEEASEAPAPLLS